MTMPLRLLIVEDCHDDVVMLIRELERANFKPAYEQVSSRSELESALRNRTWDVVLSDHVLPAFGSFEALRLVRQFQPEVPFIVVSGVIGEEIAVAVMKAGANDYVMKDKLVRLASSIERELRELEGRRARKRAELALRETQQELEAAQAIRAYLAAIVESSEDAIIGNSLDGTIQTWNAGAEAMYGYKADEMKGRSISLLAPPHELGEVQNLYDKIRRGERVKRFETVRVRKDGRLVNVSLTLSPIRDNSGNVIGVSASGRDITARKREEEVRLKLIEELTDALNSIKTLKGLLPICASCKKIRDDHGYWQKVESYISAHTGAEFTHGICPECVTRLYPEYASAAKT